MLTVEFEQPATKLGWWIFYEEDETEFFWTSPVRNPDDSWSWSPVTDLSQVDIYAILEQACQKIRKHRILNRV